MTRAEILAELARRSALARRDQTRVIERHGRHGIWDFFYDGSATALDHLADEIGPVAARGWRAVPDHELAVLG